MSPFAITVIRIRELNPTIKFAGRLPLYSTKEDDLYCTKGRRPIIFMVVFESLLKKKKKFYLVIGSVRLRC